MFKKFLDEKRDEREASALKEQMARIRAKAAAAAQSAPATPKSLQGFEVRHQDDTLGRDMAAKWRRALEQAGLEDTIQ